uniref:Uncharacterized protein n=1 Tax=Branchiostoma floridae TaxID=7739 RepID=C3ZB21_BRAFL|eukprot:XP_002594047.1 hypothetical protein BRAFLDRAFT_68513 [Branchiostoma floridae]
MAACVWNATRAIFGILAPFGAACHPTAPNFAVKTVSVLVLHEPLVQKGVSIGCGVKSFSSNVEALTRLPDDFVILLPTEKHERLHLSYYIASALCIVPSALITAACIYLQGRGCAFTEEETTIEEEQTCRHQPNNENDVAASVNEPYYSTIQNYEGDEPVNPYGIAEACSRYGRTERRSCDVRENSINGPGPRSQQCNCYNQASGECTANDGLEAQNLDSFERPRREEH